MLLSLVSCLSLMGLTPNSSALAPTNLILPTIMTVENTAIVPVSSPVSYKFAIKGDLYAESREYTVSEMKGIVEANSLLYCLIKNESSWNPTNIGDSGKAYGLLQFHKPTFDRYSAKYGLTLNYYSPIDQILLAKLMINDNIQNVRHWSVYPKCIKL